MNSDNNQCSIELRHDWYQTDSYVILNFYTKEAVESKLNIEFQDRFFKIEVALPESKHYSKVITTFQKIIQDASSYKILSTKIEVKLKKAEGYHWTSLEASDKTEVLVKPLESKVATSNEAPPYPSSSCKKQDWNKLEAELKKDEESEKPEGDAALNQLFQKIYGDGNEEVRRAMNKSFSESGGTCLSTNWNEVGRKKCDVSPPDGMEYRKWN